MEKDTIQYMILMRKWMIHLCMTEVVALFKGPVKLLFFHGYLRFVLLCVFVVEISRVIGFA